MEGVSSYERFEINLDDGTINDGGADDNFFLYTFEDVQNHTDKKYGVWLEWNYTDERAGQLLKDIKEILMKVDSIELWHVWLMDYYGNSSMGKCCSV